MMVVVVAAGAEGTCVVCVGVVEEGDGTLKTATEKH